MSDFERIRFDRPAEGIARVTLARPEMRNAQDRKMLLEIDEALGLAVTDESVKVIVVAADGPDFSSGHDLEEGSRVKLGPGQAEHMAIEEELYLGLCWRWRNLPKPTIVQVQGRVIAGGLMLVWPFDIVVASVDATFSDPVVAFGVNGHEYFTHTWELGARKAKEMLFTGAALTAEECRQLGSVNHVVPRNELESFTLDLAKRVATRPIMGLRLAKLAVNQSLEAQGQWNALRAAFSLHHLGHAHARLLHGVPVEPSGIGVIRKEARKTTDG